MRVLYDMNFLKRLLSIRGKENLTQNIFSQSLESQSIEVEEINRVNMYESYKDLVVLGSSSTEVFDYIFGDNPQYYPFWASGWCIRPIEKEKKYQDYIEFLLENISRESIIFLNFGNADIDFVLRYKLGSQSLSLPQINRFGDEIIYGLKYLKDFLTFLGFYGENIYCTFANPPVELDAKYWIDFDNYPPVDLRIRSMLHLKMLRESSEFIKVINATSDLIDKNSNFFVLDKQFMKEEYEDHHQDYSKTQKLIWNEIQNMNIPHLIPARENFHSCLYPHKHELIDDLIASKRARVRTCC